MFDKNIIVAGVPFAESKVQKICSMKSDGSKVDVLIPQSQIKAGNLIRSFLKEFNYEGYVFHNAYLAFNGFTCNVDFLIGNTVIEIDGDIHNQERKMKLDRFGEEKVVHPLGLMLIRFPVRDVYSSKGKLRLRKLILDICYRNSLMKKNEKDALRKKISFYRTNCIQHKLKYRFGDNYYYKIINLPESEMPQLPWDYCFYKNHKLPRNHFIPTNYCSHKERFRRRLKSSSLNEK